MGKKSIFFILAIIFIQVSTCFAQDNTFIIPVLSNDTVSRSFYPLDNPDTMFLAQNARPINKDDELEKEIFEDFDETFESETFSDPLFYFNYLMYTFNDFLFFQAIKPIAEGYKAIMPVPARKGIKSFFHNLIFPVRFTNSILQGKIKDAGNEIGIFLINSTFGGIGFVQVAQNKFDLHTANEDLGQTLGSYAIGNGFYIVLPILGPSTLRDLIGIVGDSFLTPVNYLEPWTLSSGIKIFDRINTTSFHIGDYEALKRAALDPYAAMRNAYIQNRKEKIKE
ncbi:VacJ family lipoprotein [Desulfobacula sp.]|jgi:phospholipid-binding lipoprotein MlaA|uniref:MlaA family lipoprotein n=1 Tax=Desulfobacula sp. TaxID=2593537 RepID=UPI0039B9238F